MPRLNTLPFPCVTLRRMVRSTTLIRRSTCITTAVEGLGKNPFVSQRIHLARSAIDVVNLR